ncbi:MAG: NAD(P)H-hydrate dehydratase [Erysipelotrichaceae bacterium]
MFIMSKEESKRIDEEAIEMGLSAATLMDFAAKAILEEIQKLPNIKNIMIVCGPGNNGGDGLALARLLLTYPYNVTLYCLKDESLMSKEAKFQLKQLSHPIILHQQLKKSDFKNIDLIVDALFGIGLNRPITGVYADWIEQINAAKLPTLSIDIASGVDANSGQVLGCAIKAWQTISFTALIQGQLVYPGNELSGEIVVKKIHIPTSICETYQHMSYMDAKLAARMLPKRSAHSHKGSYGKVIGIGGSNQMRGALLLAGEGCLHVGVGVLTLAFPKSLQSSALFLKSAMSLGLDDIDGEFSMLASEQLKTKLDPYDVCFIGNGLGRSEATKAMLEVALKQNKKIVIDGDALYELVSLLPLLNQSEATIILTPHLKEFATLMKLEIEVIEKDLFYYGNQFIKTYPKLTLVLKGETTIIFSHAHCFVSQSGNHALSKGGSGDILCGMIAGFLGQRCLPEVASALAVYLHGLSGDLLIKKQSAYTIQMEDIIEGLNAAFMLVESIKE